MRTDCAAGVWVTATAPVVKKCPFRDEQDVGTLTVTWPTRQYTLELHAFGEWLGSFAETPMTHEDFTRMVADCLQVLFDADIAVETTWTTAGMTCRAVA